MIGDLAAILGEAGVSNAVVIADGRVAVEEVAAMVRRHEGDFVLLAVDPAVPALDRAMLLAAIGPLAIERAPATRIGAIDIAASAAPADVIAAARFLATARSTTGQTLRLEA